MIRMNQYKSHLLQAKSQCSSKSFYIIWVLIRESLLTSILCRMLSDPISKLNSSWLLGFFLIPETQPRFSFYTALGPVTSHLSIYLLSRSPTF
ncbi:hypothetical protein GDO81_020321 [Engystomops pustulosus]|uniref:Uncharacterized protein n=1 Tax=Engystomops pustulosus TaxID=76066 RepID=A0AAV6ZQ88_ENGPU|nr:hypothetical protein GDO81_020321 [Engystomops pustulosus]